MWALVSQFSYRDAKCVVIFSLLVVRFARTMISQNRDKRKKSHQQRQGLSESQETGFAFRLGLGGCHGCHVEASCSSPSRAGTVL